MLADIPNVRQMHGYCSLCLARCGTVATVTDGQFVRQTLIRLTRPARQFAPRDERLQNWSITRID